VVVLSRRFQDSHAAELNDKPLSLPQGVRLSILTLAASTLTESANWPCVIALCFPSTADETRIGSFRPLVRPRGTRRDAAIRWGPSFLAFELSDIWCSGRGLWRCCGGHFVLQLR
jgi:hypothetical protein